MPHANTKLISTPVGASGDILTIHPSELTPAASPYVKSILEKNRIGLSWAFFLTLCVLVATTRSLWANDNLSSGVFLFAGVFLAVIGCLGRVWCSLFISGLKTKALVTTGPYSVCRNPLYFFSAIGALGVALSTHTFIIPVIVLVCFAIYYPAIIRAEERRLLEIHGDVFARYVETVPAFMPRMRILEIPPTYEIHPRLVARTMVEATCFVWLALIGHLMYQLHQGTTLIPTLFSSF